MEYCCFAPSPLGEILLASDGEAITGLWFSDCYSANGLVRDDSLPIFSLTRTWLEKYWAGKAPDPQEIPISLSGSPFALAVWEELKTIPYGETVSYGEIARRLAPKSPSGKMSAQAVGGAVGKNPISIIVPCHRVIGSGGKMVGYDGGLHRKTALLKLEGAIK
ncbi:MAG: methylated-DNA--[protein]-cysteine S-methyltransferase [Ruminococcaceae bacterium]|nr:methylated-DNA--[protein]-cysteine S-methyltransferase [Oscillospiraceae bacterium]